MNESIKIVLTAVYRKAGFLQGPYRFLRRMGRRNRTRRLVRQRLEQGQPLKVVIGANNKFQPGWIPTEVYTLNMLDLNDWNRYFREGTLDALLAEHVWEHLLMEDGIRAARICHRYLKRGGYLRVAVPDGLFPDPAYIEFVRPGGTGPSAYDHKELYTYRTLRHIFESAGFNVKLLEYYDEQGQFHQLDWRIEDGKIVRSRRCYTGHSFGGTKYRSLILDAIKE